MNLGKRVYLAAALAAVLVLAAAALTLTSRLTSAGSPSTSAAIEDGTNDGETNDDSAGAGVLDDGKDLLPQAGISIDAAIAAAQGAATGELGEVDLEDYNGALAFNVDIGDHDVKVNASNGAVLAVDSDD